MQCVHRHIARHRLNLVSHLFCLSTRPAVRRRCTASGDGSAGDRHRHRERVISVIRISSVAGVKQESDASISVINIMAGCIRKQHRVRCSNTRVSAHRKMSRPIHFAFGAR
jgi:hypothetical protein